MEIESRGYARLWMGCSRVLLSLSMAAFSWIISLVVLSMITSAGFEFEEWMSISYLIALVVFCSVLKTRWRTTWSVGSYTIALILGALVILIGGGLFLVGVSQVDGPMFAGLIEILSGMYLAATGLVMLVAGGLELLAFRLAKGKISSEIVDNE